MERPARMEEVAPNLFRIKIPLPTIKYLNSYIVKGSDRHLIIDTGLDLPECREVMETALRRLGIAFKDTDFFLTHFHRDHSGLLFRLAGEKNKVYFNKFEMGMIESYSFFGQLATYSMKNGFPENLLQSIMNRFSDPNRDYGRKYEWEIIGEGDQISVGDYLFQCLETPGHSPGHTCLYEPEKKILVAGDLLFADATPGIPCLSDQGNPLKDYFQSLDKIEQLDIDLILPGHRKIFREYRKRIRETKKFHYDRFDKIIDILGREPVTVFQITMKILGGIQGDAWDEGSGKQLLLDMNQVISQLRYLESKGVACKRGNRGITAYCLVPGGTG